MCCRRGEYLCRQRPAGDLEHVDTLPEEYFRLRPDAREVIITN